jgi:hypothetical protein
MEHDCAKEIVPAMVSAFDTGERYPLLAFLLLDEGM